MSSCPASAAARGGRECRRSRPARPPGPDDATGPANAGGDARRCAMTNETPRPVVAGVDGSVASRLAAEWAAREAQRRHARLRLVHAQLDVPLRPARNLLARTADRI